MAVPRPGCAHREDAGEGDGRSGGETSRKQESAGPALASLLPALPRLAPEGGGESTVSVVV